MASQQPQPRPWFRLATMAARSAPVPSPTPQPDPVPQPRPTAIRPALRATALPTQTQEPAPVATPAPPVATTQVALPSAAPVAGSAPAAQAPATIQQTPATIQQTPSASAPAAATSQTPPPAAAPKPPSPSIAQLPATTTKSSPSTLFRVSATPKASPPPGVLPESPQQKLSSPSPPPKYSPAPRTVSQAQTSPSKPSPYQAATFNAPATASTFSPKPINYQQSSPSPSPNNRRILHPPSPLTLPPSQLKSENIPPEIEQKTVLVQETKEKPKASLNNSNNVHLPRYTSESHNSSKPYKGERQATKNAHHKDKGKYKNTSDSDGSGMRIVTIAGDNKGAIMELRPSGKKLEVGNKFPGKFRTWGEGEKSSSDSSSSSSSSEEGKSKRKETDERTMTKALSLPYVNSNVQGVNNSILSNATCIHHDPGVHISLSRTAAGSGRGFRVQKHITKDD